MLAGQSQIPVLLKKGHYADAVVLFVRAHEPDFGPTPLVSIHHLLKPSTPAYYEKFGCEIDLPLASSDPPAQGYDTPHWLPVVLHVMELAA